jgi:hypothetical protein
LADAAEVLEAAEHALEGRASNSQPNLQQLPKRQGACAQSTGGHPGDAFILGIAEELRHHHQSDTLRFKSRGTARPARSHPSTSLKKHARAWWTA